MGIDRRRLKREVEIKMKERSGRGGGRGDCIRNAV